MRPLPCRPETPVCSGLPTSLRERCGGASERIDAKLVFEVAAKGDAVALSIVDKATDYIGIGLAMAINILDPDCIVLCGGLTKNGPLFFDGVAIVCKCGRCGRRDAM